MAGSFLSLWVQGGGVGSRRTIDRRRASPRLVTLSLCLRVDQLQAGMKVATGECCFSGDWRTRLQGMSKSGCGH